MIKRKRRRWRPDMTHLTDREFSLPHQAAVVDGVTYDPPVLSEPILIQIGIRVTRTEENRVYVIIPRNWDVRQQGDWLTITDPVGIKRIELYIKYRRLQLTTKP